MRTDPTEIFVVWGGMRKLGLYVSICALVGFSLIYMPCTGKCKSELDQYLLYVLGGSILVVSLIGCFTAFKIRKDRIVLSESGLILDRHTDVEVPWCDVKKLGYWSPYRRGWKSKEGIFLWISGDSAKSVSVKSRPAGEKLPNGDHVIWINQIEIGMKLDRFVEVLEDYAIAHQPSALDQGVLFSATSSKDAIFTQSQ